MKTLTHEEPKLIAAWLFHVLLHFALCVEMLLKQCSTFFSSCNSLEILFSSQVR